MTAVYSYSHMQVFSCWLLLVSVYVLLKWISFELFDVNFYKVSISFVVDRKVLKGQMH